MLRLTEAEFTAIRNRGVKNSQGGVKPPEPPRGKLKPRYEKMLTEQCITAGLSGFVGEYLFHDDRSWRIDLAWIEKKLAVEIDSSVHRINSRFQADIEKHQALFFDGWRLLRVSTKQVREGEAVKLIARAL